MLCAIRGRRRCSGRWCGGQRGAHQLRHVPRQAARYSLCLLKITRFLARVRKFDSGKREKLQPAHVKFLTVTLYTDAPVFHGTWSLQRSLNPERHLLGSESWRLQSSLHSSESLFAFSRSRNLPFSRFLWTLSCPCQWLFTRWTLPCHSLWQCQLLKFTGKTVKDYVPFVLSSGSESDERPALLAARLRPATRKHPGRRQSVAGPLALAGCPRRCTAVNIRASTLVGGCCSLLAHKQ
jgi:hypothetical protein